MWLARPSLDRCYIDSQSQAVLGAAQSFPEGDKNGRSPNPASSGRCSEKRSAKAE